MVDYCIAKERLEIRAILVGLQTLSEAKEAGDITLGDVISRFLRNSWNVIKQDEDTQKDIITWYKSEPDGCNGI